MSEKITTTEARALVAQYNLADAHVRQKPRSDERTGVLNRLVEIYEEAATTPQPLLDRAALLSFLRACGQHSVDETAWFLPTYASSISMEIVANFLRIHGLCDGGVALVEPTFDNIADILRRHGALLVSIDGEYSNQYASAAVAVAGSGVRVLVLVMPNNPTGAVLNEQALSDIAAACQSQGVIMILDTSFRMQDARACYDQYAILRASGVDYVVLEDTGKLWPTLDLKMSFLLASPRLQPALKSIYDDLLLNVSPFISCLVGHYADFDRAQGLRSARATVEVNRQHLRARLRDVFDTDVLPYPDSRISVEMIAPPLSVTATEAMHSLRRQGLAVLSGSPFFWNRNDVGEKYLRIALARSSSHFFEATELLVKMLAGMQGRES